MRKYIRYGLEALKTGGIPLLLISMRYYLVKKVPARLLLIDNPVMGKFECRKDTIDFMFSFFSYEYKIKQKILSLPGEYDTFIDIGACIGDYSIWMSKNNLRSIAFEPNPENFKRLEHNIGLNGLENKITTLNYGLGQKEEKLIFKTHPENRGYSGKYVNSKRAVEHEVEIKVFDEIFESLGLDYNRNIIMKIDAEGMEAEIIAGTARFFRNIKKVFLIFEPHTNAADITETLSGICSFELTEIDRLNKGAFIVNH